MQRSSKKVHLALLSYKLRCNTRIHSPEKSRDNTREKIRYFLTCVWYCQSAADTSLPFRATFVSIQGRFSEFFRVMAAKHWKIRIANVALTYRQVTFKLNLKGEKTKIWKQKPKVTYSVALVMAFLAAENESRQLEDLPQADFGSVPERFLLSVRTNAINDNFAYWKSGPLHGFIASDSRHVFILSAHAFANFIQRLSIL